MKESLRHAAGSLLVVGLGGTELTGLERAWLKVVRPAGIILFRRNIEDAEQTRALLDAATELCAPHAFRCVDVEGGSVDRLRDALAPIPSAQAVETAAFHTNNTLLIEEHGALIAQAVKTFGFNTTLAPVVDLALPESAKIMGTRAAASTVDGTVSYVRCFLEGLRKHKIVGCGKHFPGLGGGTLDSHLETPAIHRSLRELQSKDLAPYQALSNHLPMIMVNHATYPDTPSMDTPASISHYWITTVLRKRIGYRGIILSDDMEMGGILKYIPIEEAAIAAIRAGMNLMEICHSPELILRAYEALLSEAERSTTFRNLLMACAKDTSQKRAKLFSNGVAPALTREQFEALKESILSYSETIATAQFATEAHLA